MLTNIENRLEELFEQIELMPQDKVEAAEKVSHMQGVTSQKPFNVENDGSYLIWCVKGGCMTNIYLIT